MTPRSVRILLALALNGAYLAALLYQQASAATVLLLFWVENALGIGAHVALSEAHWFRTRDRSHYSEARVNGKTKKMRHAHHFLIAAGAFLFAHGIFVLALATLPFDQFGNDPAWKANWSDVGYGRLLLIGFAILGWLHDRRSIANVSEIELHASYHFGRTIGLQVIIIFGMIMLSYFGPFGMVLTVVAVKTMVDVAVAGARRPEMVPMRRKPPPSKAKRR